MQINNNNQKGNMTTRKITLNAEKRKVIADQFQSFFEDYQEEFGLFL